MNDFTKIVMQESSSVSPVVDKIYFGLLATPVVVGAIVLALHFYDRIVSGDYSQAGNVAAAQVKEQVR